MHSNQKVSFHTLLPVNERNQFKQLCSKYGIAFGKGVQALIRHANHVGRIAGVAQPESISMYSRKYQSNKHTSLTTILRAMWYPAISDESQKDLCRAAHIEASLMYSNAEDSFDQYCVRILLQLMLISTAVSFSLINGTDLVTVEHSHRLQESRLKHTLPKMPWSLTICLCSMIKNMWGPSRSAQHCGIDNIFSACEYYMYHHTGSDTLALRLDALQSSDAYLLAHDATFYVMIDRLRFQLDHIERVFIKSYKPIESEKYMSADIDWMRVISKLRSRRI